MKMEKTPRYTQRERNMVLGYAAQYKDVIENKRTDAESNRKKDEVWRQIAKDFNARVYHQRSAKQLRQLYKNMKLLLKKDLCGEDKGNRSFMDLLNTLSQQESVAQYITEQMSPDGAFSHTSRQQKYDDDDYGDDSKSQLPSVPFDAMDTDVIVIKSEDISDNEQTQHNDMDAMDDDDDDDDCLSTKDIPEVCLEEEDDEIFATDLRRLHQQQRRDSQSPQQQQHQMSTNNQTPSTTTTTTTDSTATNTKPEVTIQNIGGIRVGSIGSYANLNKALQQNGSGGNSNALSVTNTTMTNGGSSVCIRQTSAEQAQQHLLLNGLGLSAVHASLTSTSSSQQHATTTPPPPLPTLQRGGVHNNNNTGNNNNNSNSSNSNHNNNSSSFNQLLLNLNCIGNNGGGGGVGGGGSGGGGGSQKHLLNSLNNSHHQQQHHHNHQHQHHQHHSSGNGSGVGGNSRSQHNDYLMSLAIEERKRKIDLLNAQIDYWKTLTKKLDSNSGHNPTPACACHFPGKVNGLQTQTSNS